MPVCTDPRDLELARILICHSTRAARGELVVIDCVGGDAFALAAACADEAAKAGAAPVLRFIEPRVQRDLLMRADEAMLKRIARFELKQMKEAQCYIGIRGAANIFESSDVPRDKMTLYNRIVVEPVHYRQRVKHTRWVVLRYPSPSMAQLAQTSTEGFADLYYGACCFDYARMSRAAVPLKRLMERTDRVAITGPGTDLEFSIKGIPAIACTGEMNIPDGECFTAPVRDSINGVVHFNAPTVWEGAPYEGVTLRFEKGCVVEAAAGSPEQTRKLNAVLDQDAGARRVGEFAIGFNPRVTRAMRDILFDEKIAGSFHMALGRAYDEADNGNRSVVHWDLVSIQTREQGGGEIRFDGKLVRKDGLFVTRELAGLNPDKLG